MKQSRTVVSLLVVGFVALGCTGRYRRPVTPEKVDTSPERIARGSYIVNQNAGCGACHSMRENGSIWGGERTDGFLGGGTVIHEAVMGATLVVPNISSDVETGVGGWSDDEIMRAVRDGVHADGHLMIPLMPFTSYGYMSDDDVRSVVAFLRTVPPVHNRVDRSRTRLPWFMSFLLNRGVAHHAPATGVRAPSPPSRGGDRVKYGEYVARIGHCWECHSDKSGHGPDPEWMFGGGLAIDANGVGKVFARNLTPDRETGLGRYGEADIKQALRNGKRLDGLPMAPPMSLFIPHISGLSDEDMDALVAYLRVQKPIKNKVPDRQLSADTKRILAVER